MEGPRKTARYSFIGVDPIITFRAWGDAVQLNGHREKVSSSFEYLRSLFHSFDCGASELTPFCGGMVGYVGYEMVQEFENIPSRRGKKPYPDLYFIVPRHLVCIDHLNDRLFMVSHGDINELRYALDSDLSREVAPPVIGEGISNTTQDEYEGMVMETKEMIEQGEIFQAVLSRRTDFRVEGDSVDVYRALRALNPSPYMFLLDFQDMDLIGSSPEMLVRLEGNRMVTRPLAGTRPRDPDPEEDEKLKLDMLLDEKERAEHLMLVDLHRNDMGRVSRFGTVKVTDLMSVEKYSHVQHLVSNIESEIDTRFDAFDALSSCFPAGTVSGAPKIRAMEIIREMEKDHRGPYAGAVGYFDFTGNMDFGINIRSIVRSGRTASVQAGAGIVADSVPEREYKETGHKMEAMLSAIASSGGD